MKTVQWAFFRILLFFFCLSAWPVCAQDTRPWEQYLNEVMSEEDMESETWQHHYELLCELEQHPLDINQVSREQLEALPFLTAQQIEELIEYRDRYGAITSAGELLMIRNLDFRQRRLLTYFIYIGEEREEEFPKLNQITKYAKHELIATASIPFYERRGYRKGYLGYPYRHWLRYQLTYGNYLKIGLVGAQDAGEPFFANRNKWGYDYHSFYLQVCNLGRIENLCLGNYRVSMGMGLVMNSEFNMGKQSILQTMGRPTPALRAHSSRSAGSLLGGAVTINMGGDFRLMAFASYRPVDATLNKDSSVATLLDTDYHRTETEMKKKGNTAELKAGGSLRFDRSGFHLGANLRYLWLNRMLRPDTTALYKRYYPQGGDFLNASIDYAYAHHRISVNGETAIDKEGHLATINNVTLSLSDTWSLMALQRLYSYRYSSPDANSFCDGGRVQNESGGYVGLSWLPSSHWQVSAYADYAYYPWARYQVSQSSQLWDFLVQTTSQYGDWTFGARYRLRMNEKDGADKAVLERLPEHRVRLSASLASSEGFSGSTQVDGCYCAYADYDWGIQLSQRLSYTYRWLRLNAGISYFNTKSYDSRVNLYELGPLYTYSLSTYYGEGFRYWLMIRATIKQRLTLTAKIGVTDYLDRSVIGSGYQEITGSSMTTLDVQLRCRL